MQGPRNEDSKKKLEKKIKEFLHLQWHSASNLVECDSRGGDLIWVIWNPQLWSVDILRIHKQFNHLQFTNSGGYTLYATFVYAKNYLNERKILWNEIQN